MARLWICFHPQDDPFVVQLHHHLLQHGHRVHMDAVEQSHESSPKPSSATIDRQLRRADWIVFVCSPTTLNTREFHTRHRIARKVGCPILRVIVQPLPDIELDPQKIIDATEDTEAAIQQILALIHQPSESVIIPAVANTVIQAYENLTLYISAEPEDAATSALIGDALQQAGFNVAVEPPGAPSDSDQEDRLYELFNQSDVYLPILSPVTSGSRLMRREFARARSSQKLIIPVLVEPLAEGKSLPSGRFVDATLRMDDAVQEIIAIINAHYAGTPSSRTALQPYMAPAIHQPALWRRNAFVATSILVLLCAILFLVTQTPRQSLRRATTASAPRVAMLANDTATATNTPTRTPSRTATATSTREATTTPEDETPFLYADFSADPLEGEAPLTVTFENFSEGDILEYQWDFDGDGETDSDEENPAPYVYEEPGEYEVSLTIVGDDGEDDVLYEYIYVYGEEDRDSITASEEDEEFLSGDGYTHVQFIVSPAVGEAPLTVTFSNVSQGEFVSFEWDLNGDGTIDSTGQNPPTYSYNMPGDFRPRLVGYTADGQVFADRAVITVETPPEPYAYFDVSPDFGEAPLTVTFTSEVDGYATQFQWDFNGDGVVDSTAPNPPPYTYQAAGDYEPSLVVSGPGGTSEREVMYVTVDPAEPPYALFNITPTRGTAPLTVNFTNRSEGQITSYQWDFNDDGVIDSTAANPPPHTYNTPGDYEVSLVVTGPGGTSDPEIFYVTVDPPPAPIAEFSVDVMSGDAPLTVSFTNRSTGNITEYRWDFDGDGNIDSTLQTPPPFIYAEPGEYFAELVVVGAGGESDPATVTINVNEVELPTANFTVNVSEGNAPLTVTFTDASTGTIDSYAWDFDGDGVIDSAEVAPPPVTYETPGSYEATLIVTNVSGESDPYSITIDVDDPEVTEEPTPEVTPEPTVTETPTATAPAPPTALFSANVTMGTAPLTVTFTDASSGNISEYRWDFNGDGIVDPPSTTPPSYTYATPGTYEASLIVAGDDGESQPYRITITVTAPESTEEPTPIPAPVAGFTVNMTSGNAPLTVTFTNTSSGNITTYAWDFNGDGIVDSTVSAPPPFVYSAAGTVTASLIVSGPGGTSTPFTTTIHVQPPLPAPPTARFSVNVVSGIAPLTVTFTDESTGSITSYAWDFDGDGNLDTTLAIPQPFIYTQPGNYTARLTVTGAGGTSVPYTTIITVNTE